MIKTALFLLIIQLEDTGVWFLFISTAATFRSLTAIRGSHYLLSRWRQYGYTRKYLPPHVHPGGRPGLGPWPMKPPTPGSGAAC
jgi:hypothetical protein